MAISSFVFYKEGLIQRLNMKSIFSCYLYLQLYIFLKHIGVFLHSCGGSVSNNYGSLCRRQRYYQWLRKDLLVSCCSARSTIVCVLPMLPTYKSTYVVPTNCSYYGKPNAILACPWNGPIQPHPINQLAIEPRSASLLLNLINTGCMWVINYLFK